MVNENLGDELYDKFNNILDDLQTLPVGRPLGWLFVWDTIRDVVQDIAVAVDGDSSWGDYVMASSVDLKQVWNTFWATPWGGLDIEGSDVVEWLSAEDLIQEWVEEDN